MSAEDSSEDFLVAVYRQYVGEPDARVDIYLGFGLFIGGLALAAVALLLFVFSTLLLAGSSAYFTWVEPAYALGMLSLPTALVGIVVLLPTDRRVLAVAGLGVAIAAVAVGGFVWAYPSDWNLHGADYTVHVVSAYAIGLASVATATGVALVGHYVTSATQPAQVEADEEDERERESYSDAEIRADIDAAMEGVELSWGGVEKTEHRRLTFADDDFEMGDVDFTGKTTRSEGVDAQVAGLKGLKGGQKKTAKSKGTVDDQTQKLKELRDRRKRAEETRPTEGLIPRLKEGLQSISTKFGS